MSTITTPLAAEEAAVEVEEEDITVAMGTPVDETPTVTAAAEEVDTVAAPTLRAPIGHESKSKRP